MAKPVLLVTRKLPEAIEARAEPAGRALGDRRGRDARRATEASPAAILGAAGDPFAPVSINAFPPSPLSLPVEVAAEVGDLATATRMTARSFLSSRATNTAPLAAARVRS